MATDEPSLNKGMKVKLERFEDHHAVITTDDGQKLLVMKEQLPENVQAGDALWLHIETSALREEGRKKMAKALLDEILNPAS